MRRELLEGWGMGFVESADVKRARARRSGKVTGGQRAGVEGFYARGHRRREVLAEVEEVLVRVLDLVELRSVSRVKRSGVEIYLGVVDQEDLARGVEQLRELQGEMMTMAVDEERRARG